MSQKNFNNQKADMHRNIIMCLITLLLTSGIQAGIFSSSKKCEELESAYTPPQAELVCENETDTPVYVTFLYVSTSHVRVTLKDIKPNLHTTYIEPHSSACLSPGHTPLTLNEQFMILKYFIHDGLSNIYTDKTICFSTANYNQTNMNHGYHRINIFQDETDAITSTCHMDLCKRYFNLEEVKLYNNLKTLSLFA